MTASWRSAPVPMRYPLLVGTLLCAFYLLTFPGTISPRVSDGRSMYLVTRAIVDRFDIAIVPAGAKLAPSLAGEVAITPGWRTVPIPAGICATEPAIIGIASGSGKPYFSKFGLGQSLAAIPLYLVGLQAARLAPSQNHDEVAAFVTSGYAALVTALTAALLCVLALRFGWTPRVAVSLALLFGVSTPAWAYTVSFFSEPTIGLCLLASVAAVLWTPEYVSARRAALAGMFLGFAVLTHFGDSVLYVPVVGAIIFARSPKLTRIHIICVFAMPLILTIIVTAAYNAERFGSPTNFGYGIIGDVHDLHPPHTLKAFWEGIYGPLLSPGKGLFLYAPILLLAPIGWVRLFRIDRRAALLILALGVVCVLSHANTLIVWLGGWAWGPRFLIPILPVSIIAVGPALHYYGAAARGFAWLLGALGVVIQFPAVLLDKGEYISYLRDKQPAKCIWTAEDLYNWHPQYSPLVGQWQRLLDPHTYAGNDPTLRTPANFANGFIVPKPHPWWALLARQGVAGPELAFVVAVLAIVCLTLVLLLLRELFRDVGGGRVA
jgi:hypothetical protein